MNKIIFNILYMHSCLQLTELPFPDFGAGFDSCKSECSIHLPRLISNGSCITITIHFKGLGWILRKKGFIAISKITRCEMYLCDRKLVIKLSKLCFTNQLRSSGRKD